MGKCSLNGAFLVSPTVFTNQKRSYKQHQRNFNINHRQPGVLQVLP